MHVTQLKGGGAVPRYFFDVHDGTFLRDNEGVELRDIDAARKQVWDTLPMMAAQRQADGNMAFQLRMDVRDEAGNHLFHATLALVIEAASPTQIAKDARTAGR
jgi:uncharacterized protein DUF6894